MGSTESLNGREKNGSMPRKVKTERSIPFFTFLRAIFTARLDFPTPLLSTSGSPRIMAYFWKKKILLISYLGPMSVLTE